MDVVRGDIKDLAKRVDDLGKRFDSKFDRLMFLVVGGVVMKIGLDLYVNERNWSGAQQEDKKKLKNNFVFMSLVFVPFS